MHNREIVILEDNEERRQAMLARLNDRFPQFPVCFFHKPAKMIEYLEEALPRSLLLCLDHDLDLIPQSDGALHDPGNGMAVVDWLIAQPPACPVIIHSTNLHAAKAMKRNLRKSGWKADRITPYDDLSWINAEWFSAVRDVLISSTESRAALGETLVPGTSASR